MVNADITKPVLAIALLSTGCARRLDSLLEEAEGQAEAQKRAEAPAVYATLLKDVTDDGKPDDFGVKGGKHAATDMIMISLEKTLPAEGNRLGKLLPVDALRPKDEYHPDEFHVSQLFHLLDASHRTWRETDVDQLAVLKSVQVKEAGYADTKGGLCGPAVPRVL